jgi:thiol-disulfide isomerase/thioredoxin
VRYAALIATVAVLLAGCSDGQVQRSGADQIGYIEGDGAVTTIAPGEREPAPEFGGPLLGAQDEEFWLADAVGDIVVLNVWGSWCPPCRKEAPAFQAVWEDVADDGVRFVGVNTRDPNEVDALGFVEDFGITYPSVVDTDGRRMLAFRDSLPPAAIPSTLIIDREGRLAARVLGAIGESTLSGLIEDVQAEAEASP